jgi:molybdopterin-containing oxidoreductase family iron-sulfur binding subunit
MDEEPDIIDFQTDELSRRSFLQLMGASLALAGAGGAVGGCSDKPVDPKIVPYVTQAPQIVPGKPLTYATAMPMNGFGKGVLVTTREGRPIKIEGNPDHPASLGGTDAFMQASILSLYDPDRSQVVTLGGEASSYGRFINELQQRIAQAHSTGGDGLYLLTGIITSPTLLAQLRELLQVMPKAQWHQHDPLMRRNTAAGLQLAFQRPLSAQYDFSKAQIIVSLDADFLFDDPASVRYARQFIDGRRVRKDQLRMNRLYVIESAMTITGSMADHRLARPPAEVQRFAAELAAVLVGESTTANNDFLAAVAADLKQHRGASLVIAGEAQPPQVHALAAAMNHALGNVGKAIRYCEAVEPLPASDDRSLAGLVDAMRGNQVSTLLILGENPAYTAPADVPFALELERLSNSSAFTAHLATHEDETSFRCQWHVPQAHWLESWSDIRAFDGTASIIQPMILPLYGGRSTHTIVETLLGRSDRTDYEIVRSHWQSQLPNDFETQWQRALQQGVIPNTAAKPVDVPNPKAPGAPEPAPGMHLVIRPDPTAWDGSFTNNPWLQELPKPFTKLTWDNAALFSPATAQRLGLQNEDVVALKCSGQSVHAPVLILPGTPDDVVVVHLGYGRTHAGRVGTVIAGDTPSGGFNAYALRTRGALWSAAGVEIQKLGRRYPLATTRSHHAMATLRGYDGPFKERLKPNAVVTDDTAPDDRALHNRRRVRVATLDQFTTNPNIIRELGGENEKKPLLSLYPGPGAGGWDYSTGYQWGMSIDMTACIGCNACVVACQAENNIPVVGKEQVHRQREMHWIRIDDYFGGDVDRPQVYHQPVTCMHCEDAPCEYVCPTGATTHSAEGINQMTYNRCVGTRYCSNNCPYKVRRFNFHAFADAETTPQRKLQRNPDVTVRANGVMEKCTYCIQRIQHARIEAETAIVKLSEQARAAASEEERARLNEQSRQAEIAILERLETACQQACPTRAITFGSITPVAGQQMPIAKLKQEPHDYVLLRELTTKPRTSYLARITNPNPALDNLGGGGAGRAESRDLENGSAGASPSTSDSRSGEEARS